MMSTVRANPRLEPRSQKSPRQCSSGQRSTCAFPPCPLTPSGGLHFARQTLTTRYPKCWGSFHESRGMPKVSSLLRLVYQWAASIGGSFPSKVTTTLDPGGTSNIFDGQQADCLQPSAQVNRRFPVTMRTPAGDFFLASDSGARTTFTSRSTQVSQSVTYVTGCSGSHVANTPDSFKGEGRRKGRLRKSSTGIAIVSSRHGTSRCAKSSAHACAGGGSFSGRWLSFEHPPARRTTKSASKVRFMCTPVSRQIHDSFLRLGSRIEKSVGQNGKRRQGGEK